MRLGLSLSLSLFLRLPLPLFTPPTLNLTSSQLQDGVLEGNQGVSELAPMSTTSDPAVAIAYGQSSNALLFKINATSFMNRGADITFLSAFPAEREFIFPPLTFLRPTGRKEVVGFAAGEVSADAEAQTITVLEVEAQM